LEHSIFQVFCPDLKGQACEKITFLPVVLLTQLSSESLLNSLEKQAKLFNVVIYLKLDPFFIQVVSSFLLIVTAFKLNERADNLNMSFADME